MAASTSGTATSRTTSMNPTTTQHDFRFPRRPGPPPAHRYPHHPNAAPPPNNPPSAQRRAAPVDMSMDLSSTYATAHDNLMASEPFPPFRHDLASEFHHFDQLPQDDPLALRVWKFYAQTKMQLPDQRRMENLTWRMMHGNLMKRRHEEAQANNRYAVHPSLAVVRLCDSSSVPILQKSPAVHAADCLSYRLARAGPVGNGATNGPSGIAQQLQRSEEQSPELLDPMSLDDYFFGDSGSAPPDQGHSPADDMHGLTSSAHALAIPGKSRKDPFQRFSPQSVPAPSHENEFNYVTRHHRKTSIDERPVSSRFPLEAFARP